MSNEANAEMKPAGYCRICGKALAAEEVRSIQGTIYCAEHAPVPPPGQPVPPTDSPWTSVAPSPQAVDTSPGLAFVLGFIPGVGAIYNSQYAKGLIHVVIFGLIINILANGAAGFEPLFGLLLSAFIFYMAFEAYHTASKRQRGDPVDEFSSLIPLANHSASSKLAPIILIAVGVLFLLITLDVIRMYQLTRFWPVILIALGVYMLYARSTSRSEVDNERQ